MPDKKRGEGLSSLSLNPSGAVTEEIAAALLQERVDQLIRNYRVRGHMIALVDPLEMPRATPPELDPEFYGFIEADMDRRVACETMHVGGALHIIINNQIGFTTSPDECKSAVYATDVAKMLQSPVFHVNGEDPEAVAQVVQLAMDFRRRFQRDVVIDMYCYRRLGHNEGDEPFFTQPMLYRVIRQRKSVREGYLEHLLRMDGLTRGEADDIAVRRHEALERELSQATREDYKVPPDTLRGIWNGYAGGFEKDVAEVDTTVERDRLAELLEVQTHFPEDFHPHPKIDSAARLRRQQLYPLADEVLDSALRPYRDGIPAYWVQEEPENMGAWRYLRVRFGDALLGRFPLLRISRPASASPATGSLSSHKKEQEELVAQAYAR